MRNNVALRLALPLLLFMLLLSNLPMPSVTAASSSTVSISSSGTIQYPSEESSLLLGVGHPVWSYDKNGNPVDIQALVNLASSSGANTWREAMYVSSSVQGYYTNLKNYCDQAGLKFEIQTLSASVGAMTPAEEANIVFNVNGAQTAWINGWSTKIQQLHPYAIMVMNEPTNNGTYSTASATQFAAYRQFCINCITSWRNVQPDLVIIVQNYPFNDFFDSTSYGFASNPLPFSDVIYSRHIYYAYDNTYPPSYLPEQRAYWNAKTVSDLESARQKLEAFIIKETCPTLVSKGMQVMFDEWGANVNAPNAQAFVSDFINICKEQNIGSLYYDIVPASYEGTGLLNEDYLTLNAVGQTWAACMPK